MKKKSRVIALMMCLVMLVGLVAVPAEAVYENISGENPTAVNLLVLGDSIAEGYGVANSGEAAYGRIVADTNGWNYRNYARVANDTQDLLYKIRNNSSVIKGIKWADVINICIGSNNYLANDDVVMITIGALFCVNGLQLDKIADDMYDDFLTIYDLIRELNPDAKIIFNNIYCAWGGIGFIPFIQATSRINKKIEKLQSVHNDIVILDTKSVLSFRPSLLADDCVHPNAAGNVALAKQMLLLLKECGYDTKTEPLVMHEGVDYNFYTENFGPVFGVIIQAIVTALTFNF